MAEKVGCAVDQVDQETLAYCGQLLQKYKLKLICAESMTAGYLSFLWSLECRSGDYFLGSLICYDNVCKTTLLAVPSCKIQKYTAESAVVTLRMLDGLNGENIPQADVRIAITGLAFKTKNPKQAREIGTVYYAFQYKNKKHLFKRKFSGSPERIVAQTCNSIFKDLLAWLPKFASLDESDVKDINTYLKDKF